MTDRTPTPRRRSCSLCGRHEAAFALHLASIWIDGVAARACDTCRDGGRTWHCQRCGALQGGLRVRVGPIALCRPCSAEPGADHLRAGERGEATDDS